MTNFKVYLNPKATPPVTVNPAFVDVARGRNTISWTRGRGQTFDFVDLSIPSNRKCFDAPKVKPDKVSVVDQHNGSRASTGKFHFDVTVRNGGRTYSSQGPIALARRGGDPTIRNT